MAQVRRPDGSCFWIDTTEVSNSDYRAFLAAQADKAGQQPAPCQHNPSYEPSCAGAAGVAGTAGSGVPDNKLPVVCVDWCDAAAFCQWDGDKRLCKAPSFKGSLGNEWGLACDGGGARTFSYGNSPDPQVCNSSDRQVEDKTVDVGSLSACKTPEGVFDLSGNVSEWTDDCSPNSDENDMCVFRGGSYKKSSEADTCAVLVVVARKYSDNDLGFRCCAGATP
jgi:formylglycine-generating enzyme required for sulfatase activity